MKLNKLIPKFETHNLFFDDEGYIIYSSKYKHEKMLTVPIDVLAIQGGMTL